MLVLIAHPACGGQSCWDRPVRLTLTAWCAATWRRPHPTRGTWSSASTWRRSASGPVPPALAAPCAVPRPATPAGGTPDSFDEPGVGLRARRDWQRWAACPLPARVRADGLPPPRSGTRRRLATPRRYGTAAPVPATLGPPGCRGCPGGPQRTPDAARVRALSTASAGRQDAITPPCPRPQGPTVRRPRRGQGVRRRRRPSRRLPERRSSSAWICASTRCWCASRKCSRSPRCPGHAVYESPPERYEQGRLPGKHRTPAVGRDVTTVGGRDR
ncbi:hypothetical protein SCANM63S_07177 [Streptomyces canarius]